MKPTSRVILFSVLCIAAPNAGADEDLQTYTLDETVVTATKRNDRIGEVPQPVTLITGRDMMNRQANNAGEMLDFVPGVRIISAGTVGEDQGVSIRSLNGGPASSKSLVLVDGRPVNDPWSGGVNWNAVPFEMIDRIEVVRGPGSALYGSQATGGVINVITKRPDQGFHGWFSLGREFNAGDDIKNRGTDGYGRPEVGATKVGLNGSFGTERTDHYVSIGYRLAEQSFPTPQENDWNNFNILYKAEHRATDDLTTRVTLDLFDDNWDNRADRNPGETARSGLTGDFAARLRTGNGVLKGRLYLNRHNTDNTVYAADLKTGEKTTRTGLIVDYTRPLSPSSMLIAGIDGHYDNALVDYDKTVVDMTPLGVDTVVVRDSRSGKLSEVRAETFAGRYGGRSQSYDESNVALFAQYTRTVGGKLNMVLGGRFDVHSQFGAVFNPKAGLTYDIFERGGFATTAKVNYGTAFRAPPMRSLFSKSVGGYGDADLEPEKTKNIDVGIFQRFADLGHVELTFFQMDVANLLINDKMGSTGEGYYVFVPTEAGTDTISFNQRRNLGSYSPKGVELGFRLRPLNRLELRGAYTYLDPGDFTFQTSKNRYNLCAGFFEPVGKNRVEADVSYNHTGKGYFFDYESRPFEAFGLVDARLSFVYHGSNRISLNVKNLTDANYRLWHYMWQPGRTVTVSLESSL
ncbi:MAG: TonB-dependent receptor [Candidatus Latescibacteria bacterium]|nr:TonB-dependent receptor [Candidatus Latescibacterota bacterium]